MLELRHLRTLATLREAESLVEAAERLHLTQSALSHQLKDLEERLGLPLFVRKSKPVRFTSAGLRLLRLADSLLPQVRQAERDLQRLAGGQAGRLHMAIECHSCFQWLMPTIDQFRNAWPEVEVDFASGFFFAPLPALARGELDLVVTSDPQEINGISYVPLFTYEAVLAISNQHPLVSHIHIEPAARRRERQCRFSRPRRRRASGHTQCRINGNDDATGRLRPRSVLPAQLGHSRIPAARLCHCEAAGCRWPVRHALRRRARRHAGDVLPAGFSAHGQGHLFRNPGWCQR